MNIELRLLDSSRYHIGNPERMQESDGYRDESERDANPTESDALIKSVSALAAQDGLTATTDTQRVVNDRIRHFDGGHDVITYWTLVFSAGGGAALGAFLKSAVDALLRWKELKSSRHVMLKVGKREIKVSNPDDLGKALEALERLDRRDE